MSIMSVITIPLKTRIYEEDIINNPSNIGYNPTFGLRIIDYGLST